MTLGNRGDRLLFSRSRRKRPIWWRAWAWWDSRRSWSVEVVAQRGESGGVLDRVLDSWGRHFDCGVEDGWMEVGNGFLDRGA